MLACDAGSETLVELLLQYGAEIDRTHVFYSSALHTAARHGNRGVIKLLVERDATIDLSYKGLNSYCYKGANSLAQAYSIGHIAAFKLLLDLGASWEGSGVT